MLDNLNEMQKEAVIYKDGPLLILAGAGSGKTRVLTCRIAYLIKEYKVNPYNILAITFTNKAANEMKDRITNLIGKTNITASTFHSFGVKILREYDNAKILGYNKNFNIMDSDDTLTLIKKITKDLGFDPKTFSPYMIKNKISSCKNEYVMPEDYKAFVCSSEDDVIYKVYSKYEDTLKQNNSVDFDDLLILPIKLFIEHEDILEKYQERYKYILIDEYQDTNKVQYILTKMLCKKYRNICVVGDVDQSIYGFRNADYRNILNFEKDYKDGKTIYLEQNYRSCKTILDAANSVIKNNKERKEKNLWSNKDIGDKISYYRAYDEVDEVFYCLKKIKELINDGVPYSDIAILYRTNAQSRAFEDVLLRENIPYKVIGSFYFYNRKEIKDLISYLKLINNQDDNLSLTRAISVPKRGIGEKSIRNLEEESIFYKASMFDCLKSEKELEFKNLILDLKSKVSEVTLTELIEIVLDKSGMKEALKKEKTLEADIRLENLEEFKSITKNFEEKEGLISLEDFLLEISLVADKEEYKDDPNRLTLMTVHQVKGLEYPYVFIVGLEEGIFPHRNSMNSESEIEEERRLMYVAITRAMKKLYITNAKKRMLYGEEKNNVPSRFINEIDEKLLNIENASKEAVIKKEKNVYEDDVDYKYGDKVLHDKFGVGVVIGINKSIISIAFNKDIGIKQLLKNHKSIKKIS